MIRRPFYFMRHGQTDWNAQHRLQGWTDIPLNDFGRAQAQAAAKSVRALGVARIVASPLQRAHETAVIAAGEDAQVMADERLKERQFGIFEGFPNKEYMAWREKMLQDPATVCEENGFPCAEGAETYVDFKARIVDSLNQHLDETDGQVLFVAHGGVYRVLQRLLVPHTLDESPNAAPFHFDRADDAWVLKPL
jgi:broad specificity phosphatase PhoE